MPSAANAKSEKPASSEATDNSPIRQVITIIEHKIRNLEKRKSKLTQYRDLQKAGKELNGDQRVAVAKYDEVAQTLEFARDLFKQVTSIAISAEREAKKQAKKEAWVRYAAETNKIREVLLILDVLMQMGTNEARDDFLGGSNGAAKLTEDDLKILDDLYPEVTPKHELNEEGQPGFHAQTIKAAEHLYAIIDGKPKEVLGTTYSRIKEIVVAVHECGYFDRSADAVPVPDENCVASQPEPEPELEEPAPAPAPAPVPASMPAPAPAPAVYAPAALPVPPAPAVVPAPAYPLRPLPPITLQEVEHAYFAQQYPQQRPIAEVIGSQNFFFLQESEIDSPAGTPQPPPLATQPSPPGPIPTQTFTNQHFIHGAPMPPQPHFPPHPDHAAFAAGVPLPPPHGPAPPHGPPLPNAHPIPPPPAIALPVPVLAPAQMSPPEEHPSVSPAEDKIDDDWKETRSPEREDGSDRKTQGQGDGQGRFRRFGRGGGGSGGGRGAPNGHRPPRTGGFQGRQGGDGYRTRHAGDYQNRSNKDGYQPRHYDRYQNRNNEDGYYGNGDTGDAHRDHNGNGGRDRDRYSDNYQGGGFKGRGRGGRGGGTRPAPPPTSSSSAAAASRPARTHQYNRKQENVE